ncbi:MAG: tetratricopeptide repeat protein [Candidatus Binatia bacterium]
MKTQLLSPSELADQVEELRQERRFQEALEAVERCLQESPKHPRALLLQGRILYQEGKVLQALEALRPLDFILG